LSIKKKIICIALLGFVFFSLVNALIFHTTIHPTFDHIELEAARQNMDRVVSAIDAELDYLETTCRDWAASDQSYAFMAEPSEEYIRENLGAETFAINNLNLIYFYNPQSELIWGESFDQSARGWLRVPLISRLPEPQLTPFLRQRIHQAREGEYRSNSGILSTPLGPMLVSTHPLLSSELKGPARGILMMGRLLDPDLLRRLRERTRVDFELHPFGSSIWSSAVFQTRVLESGSAELLLKKSLPDVLEVPVLTLEVPFPRTISNTGIRSMAMGANLVLGLLMTLAFLVLINRMVVDPVQHLTLELQHIRTRNDYSQRIQARRSHGLSGLLLEFNKLLEVVEKQGKRLSKINSALKQDVEKRKDAEQQLSEANTRLMALSRTDELTRLANRRMFDEHLNHTWMRLTREKSVMSLIMCDVDYFKRFNDTYGHQAGDECLKKVARILKMSARRPADLVARYGGEEFIILLPGASGQDALVIAERIRMNIADLRIVHESSAVSDHVSISMGVSSVVPEPGAEAKALIQQADMALYEAKDAGRNRVVHRPFDAEIASADG